MAVTLITGTPVQGAARRTRCYEVVVGQAVKNLRYLDSSHISEKLALNKDKAIGTAVWHNGQRQKDRKEILKILARAGSNVSKKVCVLQPSATRSEVEAIGKRIEKGWGEPTSGVFGSSMPCC